MAHPTPILADSVLEALEAHPDGISVKLLAEEMAESESAVRQALNFHMRHGRVNRRMAPADGPTKPPYLFTLLPPNMEKEAPPMPTVNDEETEQEEGAPEDEALDDDGGPADTATVQPPADVTAQPRRPVQAALDTYNRREVIEGEIDQARRAGHKTGGTKRIERIDPIPAGFPTEEKGMIGKPVEVTSLTGSIEEYIEQMFGGGSFLIHPCGADANLYGGRPVQVDIAGLPKPLTPRGRLWLENLHKSIAEAQAGKEGAGKMPDFMQIMDMMDRRATEARRESNEQWGKLMQTVTAARPGPDPTSLDSLKTAHAAELIQVRADAEKRVKDAKEPYENQIASLEKQVADLKTEVREQRRDLEAAADRRVAEVRAQCDRDMNALRDSSKEKVDTLAANFKEKVDALTANFNEKVERIKSQEKLEYELKNAKAQPKDIQHQVQQQMIPDLVKMAVAQAKKAAGIEDDEGPGTWGDTLKEVAIEAGPDILKRAAGALISLAEAKQGQATAATAPRPVSRPATLPTPPASPRIAPNPARGPGSLLSPREQGAPVLAQPQAAPQRLEMTEEEQAELITQPAVPAEQAVTEEQPAEPPAGEETDPVATAVETRLRFFFEVILAEMRVDSDPADAWNSPIPGTNMLLEDLYYKLPGKVRRSVEQVKPHQAWESMLGALGVRPDGHPLLASIQSEISQDESRKWLEEFFDNGPWNQEEEEEQGAVDDGADGA